MEEEKPIRRLMVAIDRSSHDDVLFAYTAMLNEVTDLDAVYFIHVTNELELPSEILEKHPDLLAPVDESIIHNIKFEVENVVKFNEKTHVEYLIREGNAYKAILKAVEQKEVDLLVLGRKRDKKAKINIVKRIVRSAPCSISIIPEYVPTQLKKIIVPIDFGQNSVMALQDVKTLVNKHPNMEVVALHCYEVPTGYSRMGKSYEEFAEIMRQNAEAICKKFFAKYDFGIPNLTRHLLRIKDKNLPEAIFHYADDNNADAILIGSRGRDSLAHIILGSVTESLIVHDHYLPLIIVKSKSDYFGIKEALKKL